MLRSRLLTYLLRKVDTPLQSHEHNGNMITSASSHVPEKEALHWNRIRLHRHVNKETLNGMSGIHACAYARASVEPCPFNRLRRSLVLVNFTAAYPRSSEYMPFFDTEMVTELLNVFDEVPRRVLFGRCTPGRMRCGSLRSSIVFTSLTV